MINSSFAKKSLLLASIITLCVAAISQSVTQSWSGYLKTTTTDSLKLVLHLQFENEILTGITMDSPEQLAYNIKASKFSLQNDTLQAAIKGLGASYTGVFQSEGFISGTFSQAGKKYALNLTPAQPEIFNRPQEPRPPYPYLEEEINMNDHKGHPNIKGTLTLPENEKIKATVIIISGSGWQDRDGETSGKLLKHKPYQVIADYLTRNEYAVYRYDDLPSKVFAQSTTFDFANDIQAIVKYFQADERTKNQPIGLIGHSEGGLVAFIAAANNPSIDFIISLAGPSEKTSNWLLFQNEKIYRAVGATDFEIENFLAPRKKIFKLLEKEKDRKKASAKFEKITAEYNKKWNNDEKQNYAFTTKDIVAFAQLINSPWFFTIMKIEPTRYIKKIKSPVLALHGEKDAQGDYRTNLALISKHLPKNTPRKIESVPNINHILQTCEIGNINEYVKIEETVSPVVLENILLWLNSLK